MTLFASDPNALAQQQMGYDQFYLGANQSNRAAFDAAQARAFEAALRQRWQDDAQRAADLNRQDTLNAQDRSYNFTAQQNELARTAEAANRRIYNANHANDDQERILNEAARQAEWLPTTPQDLARLYPMLTPDRIQRLSTIASSVSKQIGAQKVTADAPIIQAATEGQAIADAGNRYNRILADQSAIEANPTTPVKDWRYNARILPWPLQSFGGMRESNVIQPSEHARALMATLAGNLVPKISPAGLAAKDALVQSDAMGKLTPIVQMPVTASPATNPVPYIQSKAEYDALPAGSAYYDSNGKLRRKGK